MENTFATQFQKSRYERFYETHSRLREIVRFDVRYRSRRLHEVLTALSLKTSEAQVLDVGCGSGHMLLSFPKSAELWGADISSSGIAQAQEDKRFKKYHASHFQVVPENEPSALPEGPFDFILSSHTLEHCLDDVAYLQAFRQRLKPQGHLLVFVPLEEPDYIPFHVRNYSMQTINERVWQAGFEIVHTEPSMFINGHIWKLLTIPSRRNWPAIKLAADALRVTSLSAIPYKQVRKLDALLYRLGFSARQAFVIAKPRD